MYLGLLLSCLPYRFEKLLSAKHNLEALPPCAHVGLVTWRSPHRRRFHDLGSAQGWIFENLFFVRY